MSSNFRFVVGQWPAIAFEASAAETKALTEPREAMFRARRAIEALVEWMYTADAALAEPYRADLSARLHAPGFAAIADAGIRGKLNLIRRQGNAAVHRQGYVDPRDALTVVRELYYVCVWFATRYADGTTSIPDPHTPFDAAAIPTVAAGEAKTLEQVRKLAAELAARDKALMDAQRHSADADAQIVALQRQVSELITANAAEAARVAQQLETATEAQTRSAIIDVMLREAGWLLNEPRDREYQVSGQPTPSGIGYVDYVLWGDDGKPLGIVEAKKTRASAAAGQHQARLYAEALATQTGQLPVIFYTNGYDTWLWDDGAYPPRRVDGFYTKDQLQLVVQRRASVQPLGSITTNHAIAERAYQEHAIRAVTDAFEAKQRKALLVMATGTGKTRTAIALVDVLMRANWVKNVLFLADRTALVKQAATTFTTLLPDAATVNLVKHPAGVGRVYASTYQTMMGLIDAGGDELRRFGPGFFDLVIVDEAHRSIYQKYGEIFDYFDALLLGLTATPKDEVDHNTYTLFELEDGVPTDEYPLGRAIDEGYLVPPAARPIRLGFLRSGIRYADLSEAERQKWDETEWNDDGDIPDEIGAAELNKWLFNADTVDKVLEVLMTEGRHVSGGDVLGKTIIFARNIKHAEFIQERFDANYPEYAGRFAAVIAHQVVRAEQLIDDFSTPSKLPQIAISVDMLDTGIDIPEVVNLVFFKPVRSKTKYWQMIGRGTRLSRDLYGPGQDKTDFVVFDACANIEFFNDLDDELSSAQASTARPLGHRVFAARTAVLTALNARAAGGLSDGEAALRSALAGSLSGCVAGMSTTNFLVRRRLRLVERFSTADAWLAADAEALQHASDRLGGLPSEAQVHDSDELAKRFDLLVYRAEVGALSDGVEVRVRESIQAVVERIADQQSIPVVQAQLTLIGEILSPEWWQDVTVTMLEDVRTRLRGLVRLIDVSSQPIVYTDFEDAELGGETITIAIASPGVDHERFRQKMLAFLASHQNDVVLRKLHTGRQLTALDLEALERILVESGDFNSDELRAEAEGAHGLGLLIRQIAGLDRASAMEAFSAFVMKRSLTANQIGFVDLVISQLSVRGVIEPGILFTDSPFTDLGAAGAASLFPDADVEELVATLNGVRETAVAR